MGPYAKPRANSSGDFLSVNGELILKTADKTPCTDTSFSSSFSVSSTEDFLNQHDIAWLGNGHDEELSREQLDMIQELYDRVEPLRMALRPHDADFCDYECCRRYLVARQWCLKKAEEQLSSTLEWRAREDPGGPEMHESPKCFKDPLAMNLRVVGWTDDGKPLGFSCFRESHDRYDPEENIEHVLYVMEAMAKLVRERRKRGLNKTAASRQFVWVIDFDGFGFRDQNPRTGILAARLMQHYPEFLSMIVLADAPRSYNALFQMVSPMLDDRVRSKILFVKGKDVGDLLQDRLGHEAAEWFAKEIQDNREKHADHRRGGPLKRYWVPPEDTCQHDARGLTSYVHSDFYIKTPGDAHEEIKKWGSVLKKKQLEEEEKEEDDWCENGNVMIMPVFAQSLYQGSF